MHDAAQTIIELECWYSSKAAYCANAGTQSRTKLRFPCKLSQRARPFLVPHKQRCTAKNR